MESFVACNAVLLLLFISFQPQNTSYWKFQDGKMFFFPRWKNNFFSSMPQFFHCHLSGYVKSKPQLKSLFQNQCIVPAKVRKINGSNDITINYKHTEKVKIVTLLLNFDQKKFFMMYYIISCVICQVLFRPCLHCYACHLFCSPERFGPVMQNKN